MKFYLNNNNNFVSELSKYTNFSILTKLSFCEQILLPGDFHLVIEMLAALQENIFSSEYSVSKINFLLLFSAVLLVWFLLLFYRMLNYRIFFF